MIPKGRTGLSPAVMNALFIVQRFVRQHPVA